MENMVKEAALRYNWVSPQEYLLAERLSEEKHEYFDGEVIEMDGASLKHEDIVSNIIREIGNKLKGKDCRIRASNLRTASPFFKSFMYPDSTIVCGEAQLSDDNFDVLQNPIVAFEVFSKSSMGNDFGRKFMYYKQIPSLQEYVLIDSFQKVEVHIYRRNPDNTWTFQTYNRPEDSLVLRSVSISILLSDIYENITFEPLKDEEGLLG